MNTQQHCTGSNGHTETVESNHSRSTNMAKSSFRCAWWLCAITVAALLIMNAGVGAAAEENTQSVDRKPAGPNTGAIEATKPQKETIADYAKRVNLPATETLDLGGGVSLELVLIPAGKFMMGSPKTEKDRDKNEGPQHEVVISTPFYMGKFEVTQDQYEAVIGQNPSHFKGAKNPVETVSWDDAQEFCKKASIKTGEPLRLPTEAEWEYACRAGRQTRFCSGDEDGDLKSVAWYGYDVNGDLMTHPVGTKKPNAWGIHDMHGNVWEWCQDWYGEYAKEAQTDPSGAANGQNRVARGGCWHDGDPGHCRSARRYVLNSDRHDAHFGFRAVVAQRPQEQNTAMPAAKSPIVTVVPETKPLASTIYDKFPFDEAEAKRRQDDAARAVKQPATMELDLGGGVKLELVLIPAGKFMMGSPVTERDHRADETVHEVTITKAFYMAKYHTTVAQFRRFVAATNHYTDAEQEGWAPAVQNGRLVEVRGANWKRPGFEQGEDHPVVEVSWNDAQEFAKWLSQRCGKVVRLPSEAEWEYACRAGTRTAYQWGDNPDDGKGWCNAPDLTAKKQFPDWLNVFNWEDGYVFTSPAGKFKPNAWGLYDMHGNARQWCQDRWGDYPKGPVVDPQGAPRDSTWDKGSGRVVRGGSWFGNLRRCRSAIRIIFTPICQSYDMGFRVVVSRTP